MKNIFRISIPILILALIMACGKEGPGGKAAIKGKVKHHSSLIPGAVIYIKYGATESPGTDITYYDASVNANANAEYEFQDLKSGDYYLFGVGFDSLGPYPVYGGIPVKIKSKTETVEIDVPVTEG